MALDANIGIEKVHEVMPDIITLDLVMPKMDGFEVIKLLKENVKTELIPIIVISGSEEVEMEEQARSLGAKDSIKKPYEGNLLLSTVQKHLSP